MFFKSFFIERPQQKLTNERNHGQDIKRKQAMQELEGSGGFPNRYLKKQTTNDRSSPCISGDDKSNSK